MASHHSFQDLSAGSFVVMWVAMMVPMMLPSLVPMLWRYRDAVDSMHQARLNVLTALVGAGYFSVWTVVGVALFPFAGAFEFTAWKARHLACCREAAVISRPFHADVRTAWQHGVHLARLCAPCCANLMVILLVVGMMDLRAMAAVTAAITAERLAPAGERVARAIGVVAIGTAVLLIAQAAGVA